ncbi:MAG: methyl-accepting chemotaxis protein [Gammaproteobacteria bacterium]
MKINEPVTINEKILDTDAILASQTNLKGILTKANRAFVEISGFSHDELVGKNHNIVRHPDMPSEAFSDLWKTVKSGSPWVGIVKNRCKNGDFYWVRATVTPNIENGEVTGYLSVRNKPSELEIKQAESLYRDINAGKASLESGFIKRTLSHFKNLPLVARLSSLIVFLTAVITGVLVFDNLRNIENILLENEAVELEKVNHNVNSAIASEGRLAATLATMVAGMPEVQQAFIDQDKDKLLHLFRDTYLTLKKDFGVQQFQFHTSPAISFVRIHKPEKYGDDLSSFRKTVVQVNQNRDTISGLEAGVAGIGIRGVVPVFQDNRHLGSVEFGLSFGQKFFDEFKAENNVELALYLKKDDSIKRFTSTLGGKNFITDEEVNEAMSGISAIKHSTLQNTDFAIYRNVVKDYSGNPIGVLAIAMDRTPFNDALSLVRTRAIIVGVVSLFLSFLVAYFIARSIAKPLQQAVDLAKNIAYGKYDNDVVIDRNDETGKLLSTMLTMQSRLQFDINEVVEVGVKSHRISTGLDNVSTNVTVSDEDNNLIYMNHAAQHLFDQLGRHTNGGGKLFDSDSLIGTSLADFFQDDELREKYKVKLTEQIESVFKVWGKTFKLITSPVLDENKNYQGRVTQWIDITNELSVEKEIDTIVAAAKQGDLGSRISVEGKEGFFKDLAVGINELIEGINNVFEDIARAMKSVAEGDLTQPITKPYSGAFGEVKNSVNETIGNLQDILGEFRTIATDISNSATSISTSNTDLSERTKHQASNLEDTASSLVEITSTVSSNADNTLHATKLAADTREIASNSVEVVGNAINAMDSINDSSKKIVKIIGVIDEIAFQTNLLALNAAVEAARAGEQGRGFAVVASEVRTLAGRSSEAAKDIKGLIDDSVSKVTRGSELVNESGDALNQIAGSIKNVVTIMDEIATANNEQSLGIQQVNQAVTNIDSATQSNVVLAQQTSSETHSLQDKADNLNSMIKRFKLS